MKIKLKLINYLKIKIIKYQLDRGISRCIYCGSTAYGRCEKSPIKLHQHFANDKHCMFCGSTEYGPCSFSPFGNHHHGPGENKCVFCGKDGDGTGKCKNSPFNWHEKW